MLHTKPVCKNQTHLSDLRVHPRRKQHEAILVATCGQRTYTKIQLVSKIFFIKLRFGEVEIVHTPQKDPVQWWVAVVLCNAMYIVHISALKV